MRFFCRPPDGFFLVIRTDYVVAVLAFFSRLCLMTLPALRHEVQTTIRLGTPLTSAWTLWRFGTQRLLVVLWAWETLFPETGFLPQIEQTFAIYSPNSPSETDSNL